MSDERKCLRCDGGNFELCAFQSTGKIYVHPNSASLATAVLSTGVPVNAQVCLDCGHVELLVDANKVKAIAKKS